MTKIPKIKICGITRREDALLAAKSGAWAAGFIFVKNSPRYIEPNKAAGIIKSLDNIEKIGVFVDSSLDEIVDTVLKTGITQIQLHGNENREFCLDIINKLNLPVIKAFRVKNSADLLDIPEYKSIVSAILLDTYSETQHGGTGKIFDWNIAKEAKIYDIPVILAGGLNPDNITKSYQKVQPYALDISSGVERSKGIKDPEKIKKLFSNLNKV